MGGTPARSRGRSIGAPRCRRKQKLLEIHQALTNDPIDIEGLRVAAVSEGGLLTDEIRRKVWPKLLGVSVFNLPPKPGSCRVNDQMIIAAILNSKAVRESHKDYNQVLMDVNRTLRRFPKGMRTDQRQVLQEQLIDTMLYILKAHPELHYYQGFHDIAVTFLLVVGERMGIALVEQLATHHLRDFMDPTIDSTKYILNYLMPILKRENVRLHDFLDRSEVGTIFALSWLITWYSHVLNRFHHILRLYDFFLASHPLMPVYFAAVIVLHRQHEVLRCDCDMPSVHQLLSRIPEDLPYEALVARAVSLFAQHPPSLLAKHAALQHRKSIAITSFQELQQATLHQRPDAVLRQQHLHRHFHPEDTQETIAAAGNNALVKMAVWGISATLGAAALAVAQTALEWAPEFLLHLF